MTGRPLPALVSPHRAENYLGARHGLIAVLVRQGRIRSVPFGTRIRIPRDEVERIATEGLTRTGRRPRVRRAKGPGVVDPDGLRALNLEDL